MGPINQNAMARGLLDWFGDDRPVVDRATLLPIGQYEDGGLTFAWPGFLKDAWEGAQRSLLDAGRVPVPDAVPGTRWSSNADALNAASIAPMAGVGMRAAGMTAERAAPRVAEFAANPSIEGQRPQDIPMRVWHTSGAVFDKFDPAFSGSAESGMGNAAYPGAFSFSPNTRISGPDGSWWKNLGGKTPHHYEVEIAADRNLTPDTSKPLWQQPEGVQEIVRQNPVLQRYFEDGYGRHTPPSEMFRLFKTVIDNGGDEIVVSDPSLLHILSRDGKRLAANPSTAAAPALMSPAAEPGGLLGGEPQPALPPLFASAEPYSLERPTDPVLGPFEMPGRWDFPFDLDRQKWQDERYQSPIDLPAPEDQFRPTFRPFAGLMR